MKRFFVLSFLLFFTPVFAKASLVISEVAWMGSADNANAEWIELYNNGENQNVDGWILNAVDGQPAILLSGIVPANSYVLLERTSDDTVQGIPAFLIYTGSLSNSGEVLELRDENSVLIDSVDGSNGWSIGGNNETKETLQRSGNPAIGNWITALRNPNGVANVIQNDDGGGNDTSTDDEQNNTSSQSSFKSKISGGGRVIYGVPDKREDEFNRKPAIVVDIDSEYTFTFGTKAKFVARTYKENGEEFITKNIKWNFGDGGLGKGREVSHMFSYPGDYVVTVVAHRTGFLKEIKDKKTAIVHIVPPLLKIISANSRYVEIKNENNKDIDLSGFVLVSGNSHFKIPEDTFILPNTTLRFSNRITKIKNIKDVSLFNAGGVLVSKYGYTKKVLETSTLQNKKQNSHSTILKSVKSYTGISNKEVAKDTNTANVLNAIDFEQNANVVDFADKKDNFWWWFLALGLSILIVIVIVLLIRQEKEEIIEGFIIETED